MRKSSQFVLMTVLLGGIGSAGCSLLVAPVIVGQVSPSGKPPALINRTNAPDVIRQQGIIFIYDANASPCENTQALPMGTGFLLVIPTEEHKAGSQEIKGIRFLITAEHVVHGKSNIIIRYNTSDGTTFGCHSLGLTGGTTPLQVRADVDLVAVYVPGDISEFRPFVFTEKDIANREQMNKFKIKEGWAVYAVGYLLGAPGQVLNIPISRFGTIDRLSDDLWYKSPPPRGQLEKGWIIEINGVPGLSGSPVMTREVQLVLTDQGQGAIASAEPFIIGLVKGTLSSSLGPEGLAVIEPE
jgi:hypothetical protein